MLYTIFSVVLNMSITASIAIVTVLLARLALKHAPKAFSYSLWAVVLFRLLCPVSLVSDFSLMKILHIPAAENGTMEYITLSTNNISEIIVTDTQNIPPHTQPTMPSLVEGSPAVTLDLLIFTASIVWICGVVAMLIFNIVQLVKLRGQLSEAILLRNNIYIADYIPTPFVIGLICPKIYLPSNLSEAEQKYIIQHEQYHIRRGDHIVKLLAFAAICIHWFNPLAWIAFTLSSKDMEMSCDEAVLKQTDKDIRSDYSLSLLQFSTGNKLIIGTPLAFSERDTKERIENIMKYKKPNFPIVILAIVISMSLTACLSSNPPSNETLVGFIDIQDDKVIFDEVEIITEEDTARIEELNLTEQDLISGYYIYDADTTTVTFTLTDDTAYHFIDIGQLYITHEESEDLAYETTSLDEFIAGSSYSAFSSGDDASDLPTGRIPYFVEISGNNIVSITEDFRYTI